jgi:hypothetical protein
VSAKWIRFEEWRRIPERKTQTWIVLSAASKEREELGAVKWFGRWRQYAFFPLQRTVFERQCLRDIADFCESETKARRIAASSTSGAKGGADE